MPVDPDALKAGMDRLARLKAADVQVEGILDEVVGAVDVLFGLTGAAFLMVDNRNTLRSVVASGPAGKALEETEQDTGQGACIDAFVTDTTISCADLGTDPRYRQVGPALVERGVHAVLGVPIRLGGPVGSLNVYVDQPHEWTNDEVAALETYGQLLGSLLGAALAAERRSALADQLQYALDYRVVIERAVGYLMAVHHVDAVDAFNRLRRAARDRQRRVADLAGDVLARRILL